MYQYYIFEIQQYANGEYGHIVHFAHDTDDHTARLKAESKYHEVLAAAAISNLPTHAASLLTIDGRVLMNQCYYHYVSSEEQEQEQEETKNEPT